jgi:hypothetical protein
MCSLTFVFKPIMYAHTHIVIHTYIQVNKTIYIYIYIYAPTNILMQIMRLFLKFDTKKCNNGQHLFIVIFNNKLLIK